MIGTRISADAYSLETCSELAVEPKEFDLSASEARASKLQVRALAILDLPRSDVALAVSRYLQSCQNFELRRVRCSVGRGELVICGQVSSYYLKQLAQESVRSLAGGNRIINRLLVVEVPKNREEAKDQESFKS